MLVWSIPLSVAASTAAITALEKREACAAAGHAAASAADYAPEHREDYEPADDNGNDDGPPETDISQQYKTTLSERRTDLQ